MAEEYCSTSRVLRLLIAEDDSLNRKILDTWLRKHNAEADPPEQATGSNPQPQLDAQSSTAKQRRWQWTMVDHGTAAVETVIRSCAKQQCIMFDVIVLDLGRSQSTGMTCMECCENLCEFFREHPFPTKQAVLIVLAVSSAAMDETQHFIQSLPKSGAIQVSVRLVPRPLKMGAIKDAVSVWENELHLS
jgi:CheY-like chemotaxis protein